MKIFILAVFALNAVATVAMTRHDVGAAQRAAVRPAPVSAAVTTPIAPADANGSGDLGYGPARTTDW